MSEIKLIMGNYVEGSVVSVLIIILILLLIRQVVL